MDSELKTNKGSMNSSDLSVKNLLSEYQKIDDKIDSNFHQLKKDLNFALYSDSLSTMNQVFSKLECQILFSRDLQIFHKITMDVLNCSKTRLSDRDFSFFEFKEALTRKYSDNYSDMLCFFGDFLLRRGKTTPSFLSTIFGLQSIKLKKRSKRQINQTKQDIMYPLQTGNVKKQFNTGGQGLVTDSVELYNLIAKRKIIDLRSLLKLETDYTSLIQKSFSLAHLVREGKVSLTRNSGCTNIEVVPDENHKKTSSKGRNKCVLHLTYQDFLELKS